MPITPPRQWGNFGPHLGRLRQAGPRTLSIVCFAANATPSAAMLDGRSVKAIHADLTASTETAALT
jgi:hypothetical protein